MKASGTSPDLIRVSVGIESVNDIINDFKVGLKGSRKGNCVMNIVVDGVNIFVATGAVHLIPKNRLWFLSMEVVSIIGLGRSRLDGLHFMASLYLAPDLPGHSLSEGEPLKSIERWANG